MSSVPSTANSQDLVRWLLTEARRFAEPNDFLRALAERLRALGVDVARVSTGVPILHPQVYSFGGLWELGKGVSERLFRTDAESLARLENSPIKTVYEGGGPVRCNPTVPRRAGEYGILEDLRRDGMTDYIVHGAPFSGGTNGYVGFATRREGGFSARDLALFEGVMPAVSINLEVQAQRRIAETLLDTYVGRQTGRRVLRGAIKRGMGENIRAVIWLCDLRDFTALSETLPGASLIDLLNGYFGAMCDAVEANGGEVLKFIGDAMLAIFPIAGTDAAPACRQALAAARAAEHAMAVLNRRRAEAAEPEIHYGIALHAGDVIYGNIGGEQRLDFTVIGPAVNLAARIEGLCRELGKRPLMSHEFVTAAGVPAVAVGEFALKGVAAAQHVYAPAGG